MSFSQNVRFSGAAPADAFDPHPPGRGLARSFEEVVRAAGWNVLAVDDWRDCGWSIICDRGMPALEVILAEMAHGKWMLQIGPVLEPAYVEKIRGSRPTAERHEVYDLATAVHAFLERSYAGLRWCWDGDPDRIVSTPHPSVWPADG